MKASIKKRWVAALRSGQYKQGRDVLKRVGDTGGETYCCLGVLCDLYARSKAGKGNRAGWITENGVTYRFQLAQGRGSLYVLPGEVVEWAGLPDDGGDNPTLSGKYQKLSVANDDYKLSFRRIATLIEKNL